MSAQTLSEIGGLPGGRLRPYLRPIKRLVNIAISNPLMRRIMTSNYRSGYVAFGEQNGRFISPRWITVDWANADVVHDFRSGHALAFRDNTRTVVYSSHVVEHLDPNGLKSFLCEAYRILKPGGLLRIEAPDAEKIIRLYKSGEFGLFEQLRKENEHLCALGYPPIYAERHVALIGLLSCYIESGPHIPVIASKELVEKKLHSMDVEEFVAWCVSLQTPEQYKSGGHINAIFYSKLRSLLAEAGFTQIVSAKNGHSNFPQISLRGIERKCATGDETHRSVYSLYVEAVK